MRIKGELDSKLFRELTRAKIRSTNAIAEKNEIKNKILNGDYVLRSELEKEFADEIFKVRQKLLGLHVDLAPRLENVSAAEASEILEAAITDALRDLAGA